MRGGSTEGGSTRVVGSVGCVRHGKSPAADQDTPTARHSWYLLHWFSTYLLGRQRRNISTETTGLWGATGLGPGPNSLYNKLYTASLGQLLRQLDVQYHLYADDSQLWVIFKPPELDTAIGQMEKCIASVQKWMLSHELKMNDGKTEFLVISSKSIARGIVSPTLHIGDHQVVATSTARNYYYYLLKPPLPKNKIQYSVHT